jgi:hypothetical protein
MRKEGNGELEEKITEQIYSLNECLSNIEEYFSRPRTSSKL